MKRLNKVLKWSGIVLVGLVAIGLVANACFIWITDTRLERQLAAIRAAGDPISLADLAPKPIPPEKNAATYFRRAEADIAAIEHEIETPEFVALFKETQNPYPIPQKFLKIIRAAFDAYPKVIPLLERAAACPDYDAQFDYSLPPQEFQTRLINAVQKFRSVTRVLSYRTYLLSAEGKHDEVARSALILFRLSRHFDRNPLLISYLVAMAVRGVAVDAACKALEAGPISKEVRDALDAELATQERMEGFALALNSERAYILESFIDHVPSRNFWLVSRGFWNLQESACLEVFPALIALAGHRGSYRGVGRAMGSYYEVAHAIEAKNSVMAALLFPGLKAAYMAVARTRAQMRSLRVLNALQTRVPAGISATPKLSELGLPAEATTDPFNGEPLHVKRLPQGWLVYSVGPNLRDDGGKLGYGNDCDVGVGPPPMTARPGH
jgi:hypothetical protein